MPGSIQSKFDGSIFSNNILIFDSVALYYILYYYGLWEIDVMTVRYNRLWKLLIDCGLDDIVELNAAKGKNNGDKS